MGDESIRSVQHDSSIEEQRFEWEKAEAEVTSKRDAERLALEKKRIKWDTNPLLRVGLPLAGAVIAIAQVVTAYNQHNLQVAHETSEAASLTLRNQMERDRADRERELQGAQFAEFIFKHQEKFDSEDPAVKCRAVRIAHLSPAAGRLLGALAIDAAICDKKEELQQAISAYNLKPFREGAADGYIRRDPKTRNLLQESCSVTTENRHGRADILVQNRCSLSTAPQGAKIYRVEYSCTNPRCGWSYHSEPARGNGMDVVIESDRTILWKRRWDGDPVEERYTMYYEVPDAAAQ